MIIQVLGSGCANCKKLFELTKLAVEQLNLEAQVKYITDISQIVRMGLLSSPVLTVNHHPVLVGKVPNLDQLKQLLSPSCSKNNCTNNCNCGDQR